MTIQAIQKLSTAERLLLLEKIWNTITPDEVPMTNAQKKELDHRLEHLKKGETKLFSWEEVRSALRK